ncbi:GNAT family N-acetyltransferase [Noviherbaspirillum massiliense]|uniref:GNAT family N-acetyltransferase n=1 Tax=Noviherbaspirillum massiliense TaxID=1465823 RepID=UPI00031F8A33|nr:GNAT family N-acetyltransferase [Noviherbaspirillum massiliense]
MSRVAIYSGFEELPDSCMDLFARASEAQGVFFSLPWFRNLAATVFADAELRIYVLESSVSGKPLLVLPMRQESSSWCSAHSRRLAAAANFYSPMFGPIVAPGAECRARDMELLARAIARDTPCWHAIDLHPLASGTPSSRKLTEAFRSAGMAVQTYFCFGNWYLDVKGRSYQEYFASLPSRLRNTLTRKTRQLESDGSLRLEIISSPADIARGIAAYQQVYRASWKVPEAIPAFIPGLLQTSAEQGWLRLGIAYINDEPAAAQIWLVGSGVASIYKLAYDERFSRSSVGTILTAHMMRHAIDVERVREVDYLSGDDPYKQDWMSHRRERSGILAFNLRTLNGSIAAIRHLGGQKMKKALALDLLPRVLNNLRMPVTSNKREDGQPRCQ